MMGIQERYAVYHADDPFGMITPQAAHWYADRYRHYTHVADVVAVLEQVFALTNHIDHPWTSNPEVVWHTTVSPLRSTSVADVIVSQETGRAWLVMPTGFPELAPRNEPYPGNYPGPHTPPPPPAHRAPH